MDIFNLTNNRLIEKGFNSIDLSEIEDLGAVTYRSFLHNVIMKKIHKTEELDDIGTFSIKIRNIMLEEKVNTCNTYILFCVSEDIDYETFILVERDTRALRKYVIRNEMDLSRIPFLDNLTGDIKINKDKTSITEENIYLNKINEFISTHNGRQTKLTTLEIEDSVKMIIDLVEKRNED